MLSWHFMAGSFCGSLISAVMINEMRDTIITVVRAVIKQEARGWGRRYICACQHNYGAATNRNHRNSIDACVGITCRGRDPTRPGNRKRNISSGYLVIISST